MLYPFLLLLFVAFVWGIALMLSVLNVVFRDVRYLLDVFLPLGFWLTPVVWRFEQVPPTTLAWLKLNPITWYFQGFQHVLVWQTMLPSQLLCLLIGLSCSSLFLGLFVFKKFSRRVTKWL
jgi:ABC-type polysaccharide/polyol phosphate export permease